MVPNITLNNGLNSSTEIPQLGFGVFQVDAGVTERTVTAALEAGYRHIDTASAYGNEGEVGAAIARSGIARDELFVTTKLWNADQRDPHGAFAASVDRLGLDPDLYLVHWPVPSADRYVDAWRGLEKLAATGHVRAIGVSNFQPAHIERLRDETGTVPAINQVELHPGFPQAELRAFHAEHGIATEAWGPLAQGGDVLRDERVVAIGRKHGKSAGQVILRWHVQLGNVVIPKSVTPSRIAENIDVFDFALDDDDLATIATFDTGRRIGPDPDTFSMGA